MNIITLLKLLILNMINLKENKNQKPVRLNKKQQSKFELNMTDLELIIIILFGIVIVTSIILLVTSCTDSGLIYNGELA